MPAKNLAVAVAKKTNGKPDPKHNIEAVRQAYYERIAKHDMTPLWKVMNSIVTKEPVSRCAPVNTETATGTRCRLVSRFSAVTTSSVTLVVA